MTTSRALDRTPVQRQLFDAGALDRGGDGRTVGGDELRHVAHDRDLFGGLRYLQRGIDHGLLARAQSRLSFPFLQSGRGDDQLVVAGLDRRKDEGACTVGCCIKPDSGLRVLQSDGSARDDGAGSVRDRSLDLPGSGLGVGWQTSEKNDGGEKQNLASTWLLTSSFWRAREFCCRVKLLTGTRGRSRAESRMFSGCYVCFERRQLGEARKEAAAPERAAPRTHFPVGPECPLVRLCKKLFGELVFAVYVGEALVAALIGKCQTHVVDP